MIWFSEVRLNNIEKLFNDFIRRCGSINEEQIIMLDSLVSKTVLIILVFIQTDYTVDSYVLEDLSVLIRMMTISVMSISGLNGSHESDKLSRDDHIKITVLNSFIVLILFNIKSSEIVPSKFDAIFKTLKTMKESTVVEAVSFGGVSIVLEEMVVGTELLVSLLCGHLKDDDHESSH